MKKIALLLGVFALVPFLSPPLAARPFQENVEPAQDPQPEAVAGCPENTPEGREADPLLDCLIKVGMTKKQVNAALGGSPTSTRPGMGGDTIHFYEYRVDDSSGIIATVVFDKGGKVKFWRSYLQG